MDTEEYTDRDVRDYAGLLHLVGEYAVMELKIEEASWLKNRRIAELDLPDEGILVLGVEHPDGHYVGAPRPETVISRGDRLLLYGRSPDLAELGRRKANPAGDAEHEMAIAVEQEVKNSKAG
jgi:Trk K+ transport system NAD-binding subunit